MRAAGAVAVGKAHAGVVHRAVRISGSVEDCRRVSVVGGERSMSCNGNLRNRLESTLDRMRAIECEVQYRDSALTIATFGSFIVLIIAGRALSTSSVESSRNRKY